MKKVKIYIDSADKKVLLSLADNKEVKGFTTNPSFMKLAGVKNYEKFAKEVLQKIKKPISFEVIADDFDEMEKQARLISSWGKNVFVKIPITNTDGKSTYSLIEKLSIDKIKLNITAITTVAQVKKIIPAVNSKTKTIISVFAGRIADTGRDPSPIMSSCAKIIKGYKNIELLWASYREPFNVIQAEKVSCDIITVKSDFLSKKGNFKRSLVDVSLDTVKQFYKDAHDSNFKL